MTASLTGYIAEKRAHGVPWSHIANMAGCCAEDLRPFHGLDLKVEAVEPKAEPVTHPAPVLDAPAATVQPKRRRREPGGLLLAVMLAVGDGYSTSLRIAGLLETSGDNVNGALARLEAAKHVDRASHPLASPVVWAPTDVGMAWLRVQLVEGFE